MINPILPSKRGCCNKIVLGSGHGSTFDSYLFSSRVKRRLELPFNGWPHAFFWQPCGNRQPWPPPSVLLQKNMHKKSYRTVWLDALFTKMWENICTKDTKQNYILLDSCGMESASFLEQNGKSNHENWKTTKRQNVSPWRDQQDHNRFA